MKSKPLSLNQLARLHVAHRQLDRAMNAVKDILGEDYFSPEGERLLDGFEIADHHLEHAILRESGNSEREPK